MNDCLNAEMRDRLPDLLHERLAASVRAEVNAHVAACADCREELELLRGLNAMLARATPHVDIAYVVSALPQPPARVAPRVATQRTWADWRIAAAVTLLVAGGGSAAVLTRAEWSSPSLPSALAPSVTDSPSVAGARGGSPDLANAPTTKAITAVVVPHVDAAQTAELGMAGHLADLDEQQLQALIDEIEQMKAVPITEPEPVAIKVDPRNAPTPEAR